MPCEVIISIPMNINYVELYGVKPNESDFSCSIERSLKNGVVHISENFISTINDIRNKRVKNYGTNI